MERSRVDIHMYLHTLKCTPGSKKRRMRVGRGESSGMGKTCGRGNKGQMARPGHKHKEGFEGGQMRLIRRIPKRGFHHKSDKLIEPVNLSDLSRFADGAEISLSVLQAEDMVSNATDGIKILGRIELKKKFTIKAHAFSSGARAAIEAAGGVCEVVKI